MSSASSWQGNNKPSAGDNIRINGACIVDNAFDGSLAYGTLQVTSSGSNKSVSWPASPTQTLNVSTVVSGSNAGSIDMTNGGTLQIQSGWTSTNTTLTAGAGTVIWNVAAALPTAITTYNNLTIGATGTVTASANFNVNGTLTVNSGAVFSPAAAVVINNAAAAGTITGAGTVQVKRTAATADFSSQYKFTTNTLSNLTVEYAGTAAQTVSALAYGGLKINNSSGVTLASNTSVSGVLTMTSGNVTTGSNALSLSTSCASSISRTSGYVIGNLRLTFPSGTTTCTYPIGSGSAYTPINLTLTASSSGTLTGSTTGSEHPQIATSTIDSSKSVNRYWTLWATGDTISATSYNVTLNFVAGDVDAGATATNFAIERYNGVAWSLPYRGTATSTSMQATNLAGPITSAIGFAVGEISVACPVPSGLPSNMTCVCDNFGRTSLNPSTINGGNWTLSSSGGSFGVPKIVNSGFLRMTNNANSVATAATMPGTFPAAGNLITVEFKHYAYNGSGADGIAVVLSDATITPVPGAFGGSMGYAQKSNPGSDCTTVGGCPGFAGGWMGVAIDEFGYFAGNAEGRIGGTASGATPDQTVSVRGSGSGQTGYPYMAGTGELNPAIDNPGSTTPSRGYAYRIMVDARCYQRNTAGLNCNNAALSKKTQVTANRDTTGVGTYDATNQLVNFDAYAANASQADVPANWKLSITGSTGGLTNIHEISDLRICAQTVVLTAGYSIQVDNLTPTTCTTSSSGKPIVTVSVTDTNGNVVTNYTKTVTLSATLSGGAASTAAWSLQSGSGTLSGNQYTFVAADNGVAKFYLTDSSPQDVYITVSENGGSLSSSLSTPVQYRGASFSMANNDALGDNVVAGRPHKMRITRSNGCSTDSTYTGSKNLDGWYTAATDHPSGANAPQICTTNGSNSCLPSPGASCQTLPGTAPALNSSSSNMPALNFSSGIADFCLKTTDVGKYSVSLRDDANTAAPVTGSSTPLTARPFSIVVSGVQVPSGNTNPANNSSTGSYFAKAGARFQATVGGYLWNTAGDADGDGLPDVGVNLSNATGGGVASHYADTVVLAAGAPFFPAVPSGTAGTLTGGSVAVSAGTVPASTLSYNEVGTFTLSATPSTNYLNSGVSLLPRVAVFANPSSTAQTGLVGRFIPDHFLLTPGSAPIVNRSDISCSGSTFTYMGEPLNVNFTLTAQSSANTTTVNYSGAYVQLTSTNASNWTSIGTNNSMGLWMAGTAYPVGSGSCNVVFGSTTPWNTSFSCTGVANPSAIAGIGASRVALSGTPTISWNNGVGTFSANALLQRAATPDGPYETLNLGIWPQDNDGVTLDTSAKNLDADASGSSERALLGTSALRFGRIRPFNAFGSELLNLPVRVEAQYWGSSGFSINTDDSCTAIPGTAITMDTYRSNLSACETLLPAAITFINGKANMVLSKPGNGNNGSVNLTFNLGASVTGSPSTCVSPSSVSQSAVAANLPYLQGNWFGSGFSGNPVIRATFGGYRGGPIIYMREMQ